MAYGVNVGYDGMTLGLGYEKLVEERREGRVREAKESKLIRVLYVCNAQSLLHCVHTSSSMDEIPSLTSALKFT
jgi:hypothetical protein